MAFWLVAIGCTNGSGITDDVAATTTAGGTETTTPDVRATTAPPSQPQFPCPDGSAARAADACPPPRTIEEFETAWAARRTAIVARLSDGDFGVGPDDVLRGPGGFEVDLAQCPQGWQRAPEGDAAAIDITFPLSGVVADYQSPVRGMEAYFARVNEQGGIGGRPIRLTAHDDSYWGERTVEIVDRLVAEDQSLAMLTFGTPTSLEVGDSLDLACTPHIALSPHPAFADPANDPFVFGLAGPFAFGGAAIGHDTEAVIWGEWLASQGRERPSRVVALVMDNEFGLGFADAFTRWADGRPEVVADVIVVLHDPAAPQLAAEMAEVAAAEPDVFIAMTAGNPCLLAVQGAAAHDNLALTDIKILPTHCKDPHAFLIPAGDAADGWWSLDGGIKQADDPTWGDDPFIAWVQEEVRRRGLDPELAGNAAGYGMWGWTLVEAMRIAAELPGGLDRANLILALRSLDLDHPMVPPGIVARTRGALDAYLVEGARPTRYDVAEERWIPDGPVFDVDGETPNCSFSVDDTGIGRCVVG